MNLLPRETFELLEQEVLDLTTERVEKSFDCLA